jgi:Rps23 Pro-64 3,4-dihydroxylase Tpa1-like proline 4-hydroxylase
MSEKAESPGPPQTPIAIFDEFLVAEEWRHLLDYTLGHAEAFAATQVIGANGESRLDQRYRRSKVLFDLGPFHQMFVDRLLTFLPHVVSRIGDPGFGVSQVEVQLTGTNNQEFFRIHTDNDSAEVSGRRLTFVYFFYREPRGFAGGELRIYDTLREDGQARAVGPYRVVYPLQNQIVFFPSGCLHEVLPVGAPSGDFADSRFTVNGWFHQ